MNALTFQGNQKISYASVNDPKIIAATDVIAKVKMCAICGSDLHVYHEREKGIDQGTVMGHEFTGEVVEVGKDVRTLKRGDLVMSPFSTSCGHCFYCKSGLSARCVQSQLFGWVEKGNGLQGGQAEYVRVPLAESTLIKIPEGISTEEALMLGDIIPTGFFCALQSNIHPNGNYAVVGCGPVGLMAIIGARILGAQNIYAVDTIAERLESARKFGAIPINGRDVDPVEVIRENTNGRGADSVMEAVGSFATGRLSYELVRPGGTISMVGVCTDQNLPFSPADAYNKNLTFRVGRCPARSLMDRLIPVVQSQAYDFSSIITHRMPLSRGAEAYDIFANKKDNCLKVVLS